MITCCLPVGDSYGWGVAGKNIYSALSDLPNATVELSNYQSGITPGVPIDKPNPILNCLSGPSFLPFVGEVRGTRNVAYGFIEDFQVAKEYAVNARRWDHICCGSTWMERKLRDIGIKNVSTVLQGTDSKLFNEDQRSHSENEFVIFSGGKFEYRKGNDLALFAARQMMKRHADVRLVCCWYNPWPQTVATMQASNRIEMPPVQNEFRKMMPELMEMNGIPDGRWEYIEAKNSEMPAIYGSADVGLFLSRAEGGQNLMLQDGMACALPAIATFATGQRDILTMDAALCLDKGKEDSQTGWFEPVIGDVIDMLEWAYSHRNELSKIGLAGSRSVKKNTWTKTALGLRKVLAGTEA